MRPEPLALRDGDRDPVADVLAERPADLRTQRHHVTAGSGDHRPDVLELHLVDRHIDPYGLAGTEELGRVGNLDAAPGVALDLDADRCFEALPRCSHASTLRACATHSGPAIRHRPSLLPDAPTERCLFLCCSGPDPPRPRCPATRSTRRARAAVPPPRTVTPRA